MAPGCFQVSFTVSVKHSGLEATASIPQSTNPDLVDWGGPGDPINPMNWPLRKKVAITITVALLAILTYEAAS
ncbi:unnamed protein product [Penicillium camemberti]|uniref:Str. FM013 n=1 Tax=Penicillium camemberti (strain FM 013) TaxID=1429867 RepID=A0A0G4PVF0_PENC3|nr:unnamed protein product [Penicillium camemberti]